MVDVNARVSQSDKETFSNQELRNTSRNRGSVSPMFVTSSAGLSKARLARLHDVMAGFVERGEVPGLVTLVSRRGETHVEASARRRWAAAIRFSEIRSFASPR